MGWERCFLFCWLHLYCWSYCLAALATLLLLLLLLLMQQMMLLGPLLRWLAWW
jgi:hypothetical protein